ncbi:MAG TPA: DUF1295 domain-containing protein [Candidatus Bathyarchaeia archaeon]|nr:DUF1295 domain-containing protein [Candidatus Bathyarchaeia archaeon]
MFAFVSDPYSLVFSLGTAFLIQIIFFILAAAYKTDKVTDLSYGLSFVIITLLLVWLKKTFFPLQIILAGLVIIWGLRLAVYLFIRILRTKKDVRFDGVRENLVKFGAFWFFQALTVWIIMLPSTIALSASFYQPVTLLTFIGGTVWFIGLGLETVADWQKFVFKSNPENRGQWLAHGLWQYSRHPNYFGEMLCWWGLFLIGLPYLSGWLILSLFGPFYITFLLLFVSGIPPLEKRYDQRWQNNKSYQEYKRKTSLLVPFPPKK